MSAVRAEPLQPNLLPAIESAMGPIKSRDWLLAATATAYDRAGSWGVILEDVLDCPAVLAADMTGAAFLMEFLPSAGGTVIEAAAVFGLARSLHSRTPLPSSGFPSLAENVAMRLGWAAERFARPGFEHYLPDLQRARRMTGRLLDTAPRPALLHGDFQRKNLIPTASGLKMMDPHPCLGDPVFDGAFWLALVDHDQPLDEILCRYPARNGAEFDRFLAWVWALSVIENRPLTDRGTQERSEFIDAFRGRAAEASAHL